MRRKWRPRLTERECVLDCIHLPIRTRDALPRHLVDRGDLGTPYHFRSCRLQDWGASGWSG
jgi:hypothetical protein